MADSITIHGLEGLLQQLDGLESLVSQKRILSKALREGAQIIADEAEQLAPYDTGQLANSMMYTITEASASFAIAKIGPSRKGFYGIFDELGTAHQTAEPFLGPSLENKGDEALSAIAYFLEKGIAGEIKRQ